MKHLDWTDRIAVIVWLEALRTAITDADDVADDMLRRPRHRALGPHLHRALYRDAANSIRALLEHATPEPDRGDPAGNGSSPAE